MGFIDHGKQGRKVHSQHFIGISLEEIHGGQSVTAVVESVDHGSPQRGDADLRLRCIDRIEDLSHTSDDRFTNTGVDQTTGENQRQIQFLVEEFGDVFRILFGQNQQLLQQTSRFTGVGQILDVLNGD